jgi:hypothetical protein
MLAVPNPDETVAHGMNEPNEEYFPEGPLTNDELNAVSYAPNYVPPGPSSNAELNAVMYAPPPTLPEAYDPGDALIQQGIDESTGTERTIESFRHIAELETYE